MAFLYPLASSSKGNCSYVGTKENGLLIDAGVGIRTFAAHMSFIGIHSRAIKGIFITHEHSDHIKGLSRIQTALRVPVYASKGTLASLIQKGVLSPHCDFRVVDKEEIVLSGMTVKAFHTPHDSAESQCYRVMTEDHKQICVCTDLGHMTEEIHQELAQSDLVMLESNYEEEMLRMGRYPAFLKRRIAGKNGHLSNCDCADEIAALYGQGIRRFVLGHLSEENNRPEIAFMNIVHRLSQENAVLESDYQLTVAPKTNTGKMIEV